MGPIKAALESSVRFLAKSFSADSDSAVQCRWRGSVEDERVGRNSRDTSRAIFTRRNSPFGKRISKRRKWPTSWRFSLSERSSGVNGTTLVVDAGLGSNYFDQEIIRLAMRTCSCSEPNATPNERVFENVCIESLAVALPDEIWTSADIEERLRPLYDRLKLPVGRLELMTGIRERRMWPAGTRPSDASAAAGRAVLGKVGDPGGARGTVHSCGRESRHARARDGVVCASKDRPAGDGADLRCLQRVSRISEFADHCGGNDRSRADSMCDGRRRARTAVRWSSKRCARWWNGR